MLTDTFDDEWRFVKLPNTPERAREALIVSGIDCPEGAWTEEIEEPCGPEQYGGRPMRVVSPGYYTLTWADVGEACTRHAVGIGASVQLTRDGTVIDGALCRTQKDIIATVLNLPAVWRKRLEVARSECMEAASEAMAEMAAAEQRKIKALLDCSERLERIKKAMRKAASSVLAAVADKAERDSTC